RLHLVDRGLPRRRRPGPAAAPAARLGGRDGGGPEAARPCPRPLSGRGPGPGGRPEGGPAALVAHRLAHQAARGDRRRGDFRPSAAFDGLPASRGACVGLTLKEDEVGVLLATGTVGNGRRPGTGGDRHRSPGGDPGSGPHRWWAVLLPSPAKSRSLQVPLSITPLPASPLNRSSPSPRYSQLGNPMLLLSVLETLQDEARHEAEETLGLVCEAPTACGTPRSCQAPHRTALWPAPPAGSA